MTKLKTLNVKLPAELLEELTESAKNLRLPVTLFVERALRKELEQTEIERLREEIALLEIHKNILAQGQTMPQQMLGGDADGEEGEAHCGLCLKLITSEPEVGGPRLCKDCLDLAVGADFSPLAP